MANIAGRGTSHEKQLMTFALVRKRVPANSPKLPFQPDFLEFLVNGIDVIN
jgi:hypothetical protein